MELHEIAAALASELESARQPHESWELRNWPRAPRVGTEPEPLRWFIFSVRDGFGSSSWTVELMLYPTDVESRERVRARVAEAYDKLRHVGSRA